MSERPSGTLHVVERRPTDASEDWQVFYFTSCDLPTAEEARGYAAEYNRACKGSGFEWRAAEYRRHGG